MNFRDYQKQVDEFVSQFETPYWPPHEILARLTEENGELARLINDLYGNKKKKAGEPPQELGEELADIMFAVICMANSQNIDLDKAFQKAMKKSWARDSNRFKRKSS